MISGYELVNAAEKIAKAIEAHGKAQIVAAKIAANSEARAAGLIVRHRDVDGER